MPCERVNCAQCLTVMALRNQTRRVKQFLARFDKTQPFDPYVVVAFTSLPRFIRFSRNEGEDILQVQDYLLLHPNDPHLSFNELSPPLMQPNQPWNYQVRPILLHHLSLQERRSRHRHHDNHVRLFQSPPNSPSDLACVWVSLVGLGPRPQLPHNSEAGLPHLNTCDVRPSQSFE